ncbi:DUF6973 domain-containing protein [Dokdonia sp. Dokd-P16]|uniref:DUF6973 domain-containing protein n=1 Tax=Dokdonia sp. Dokd-P16 TaxID=2173169 RepID=UPI0013A556D0|nr:wnt family protein [Dokdonia sp. Dokd-P16]
MDFKQLWSLFWLSARHPRFVIPTIKGTRKTVAICNDLYGEKQHLNGPENAFRHALWNMLIVHLSVQRGLPLQRSLAWTKRFTDWHEDFSPNAPLERAMDLHNNRVGRDLITSLCGQDEEQLVTQLLEMVPLSRKRTSLKEIKRCDTILVHLE